MMVKKIHQWKPQEALRRAVHINDDSFLHIGGKGDTTDVEYSWKGTREQFLKLDISHDDYRLVMPD